MDAKQVWQAALERLRQRISPGAYATWFQGTCGVELTERRLVVGVANTFAGEHLQQRFQEMARVAVSEVLGQSAQIVFIIRCASPAEHAPTTNAAPAARPARAGGATPSARARLAQRAELAYEPIAEPTPRSSRPRGRARQRPSGLEQPVLRGLTASGESVLPPTEEHAPLDATGEAAPGAVLPFPAARSGSARLTPRLAVATLLPPARVAASAAPLLAASHTEGHAPHHDSQHDLNPRYLFETFVVGTANRLAYAAAQEVAGAPGQRYNPLLIYGDVGLGKTHLLHAIGHRARRQGQTVAYVTAERFTNEIIEAIRQRTTEQFRRRYRAVDVLLVDDVQFIAGKESTEEEFFHTFNWLHEADKQIVLSSDRVPQAMRHLHDRLRSRFAWGLMADIQAPEYEHRLDILRAKVGAQQIVLTDEALAALAAPTYESIRELEGALTRAVAFAQMRGQPLDAEIVAQALAPLTGEGGPLARAAHPIDERAVMQAVAAHYDVSVAALLGKTREHQIAWARQVTMYLLREATSASLLQIGLQLGGRDHTTVMHGCARVAKALDKDARVRADLDAIRSVLRR